MVNSMLAALASESYETHLIGAMIETIQLDDAQSVTCDTGEVDYRRPVLLPRTHIMANVLGRVPLGDWVPSCVFYPDLLGQLLFTATIDPRDIVRMIARCLEHTHDEHFGTESLRILLRVAFPTSRLYLQPWLHPVDPQLYAMADAHGVTDVYYQAYTSK